MTFYLNMIRKVAMLLLKEGAISIEIELMLASCWTWVPLGLNLLGEGPSLMSLKESLKDWTRLLAMKAGIFFFLRPVLKSSQG